MVSRLWSSPVINAISVVIARVDTTSNGFWTSMVRLSRIFVPPSALIPCSHKADAVIDGEGTVSASHIDSYRAYGVRGDVVDDPIALHHRTTTLYMNTDRSSVRGGGVNHIVVNHSDTGKITSSCDKNSSGVRRASAVATMWLLRMVPLVCRPAISIPANLFCSARISSTTEIDPKGCP